jgi:serine/threonine protein kinase
MLGCINNEATLKRCLALEYCDGGDLESALLKPAPHNLFFRAAHGLSHGMAYLHNRQIIHRDIKPSNVLIQGDYANGRFVVKLTDFGVARKTKDECRYNYTAETGTYRWMVNIL